MKPFLAILLFALLLYPAIGQTPPETYPDDPASMEQAGVPKGELLKFSFTNSKIFPGTQRDYWIYVPAQYKPDQPACVYVNQDGVQWKAPTVFDNLIASGQMPVTIGVFVNPGWVRAANKETALDRANRSVEYDGLGDAYVRFLLEELLPDAETQKTGDGRAVRLSKAGNDRAIGGASSGAICAFTAAWERPTAFSRVFSAIGTYVGLRGGDRYNTLVRKYEPKPIRVFLQDGANDLNIYGGDWWMANQTLERALTFNGYEVKHVWGEGAHNGKHGTSVFAEAMRFLWQGWPKPVQNTTPKNALLASRLIPGEGWQLVGEGYAFTEGTAVNQQGEVFFQDVTNAKTYKVNPDGKPVALPLDSKRAAGTAFGPDGRRYVATIGSKQVLAYSPTGSETVLADNLPGNDIVVAHNGNIYITAPDGQQKPSKLYLIRATSSTPVEVDAGLKFANGLCLSPDQTQLYVTESASHWVWAYQILPDGTLVAKQRFGWLHVADTDDNAWGDGLKCDQAGNLYVTTRLGIQVMDQLGRVNAIIPVPGGLCSNLCFGGPNFDMLYVSCEGKLYRRKLNTRGANAWDSPAKPEQGRL